MAQKITTVYLDDLTGEESDDVQTVEFGIDGYDYEIDLTEPNATALRDVLVHYIERGRRRGRTATGTRAGSSSPQQSARNRARSRARSNGHSTNGNGPTRTQLAPGVDPKQAREWARRNGYTVPERGRLPGHITDAYTQYLASV